MGAQTVRIALLGLALTAVAACLPEQQSVVEPVVVFTDDFGAIAGDNTERAYAVGAEVTYRIRLDGSETVPGDWQARSSASGVLEIIEHQIYANRLEVVLRAISPGEVTLTLFDDEGTVAVVAVRVDYIDQVHLIDRALQRSQASTEDIGAKIQMAVGFPTAIEVRYLDADGRRLWGKGLLDYPGRDLPEEEFVDVWMNVAIGTIEYLLVQVNELGSSSLQVAAFDVQRSLQLIAVDPAEIATVNFVHNPDSAIDGDRVCAALVARDSDGGRVFAPPAEWTVYDESREGPRDYVNTGPGMTDLRCYDLESERVPVTVVARVGDASVETPFHGDVFFADLSESSASCAIGWRGRGGACWAILLTAVVLVLRRRSRS